MTPEAIAEGVQAGRLAFEDSRYDEMLFRWRARNWPQTLTAEELQRWAKCREARLMQGEGGARTLETFAEELEALTDEFGENVDERTEELCGALYDWMEIVSNSLDEPF